MKFNFQIVFIMLFILFATLGVLVFSGAIPLGNNKDAPGSLGTVVLLGTVKSNIMSPLLENFNAVNPTFVLKYEQKDPDTFDQDLLEALANGAGPDLILTSEGLAFHYRNKIFSIPYGSYPLASYKNNFASASEVFLTSSGILAFPITVDPLMMYYNRSILDANGVVYPPVSWEDLTSLVPKLTEKDESGKIIKSTVAMGHFSNVTNAKDILAALFMQAGSSIVAEQGDGTFKSSFNNLNGQDGDLSPILKFYTSFADPNQSVYSWNKSLPNSIDAFSRGDVAFYFGFASELSSLINRNPNQNLGVASFPQMKNAGFKSTGAHVMGVAILASSRNFNTAFTAANLLANSSFASGFATATSTMPARRDLLAVIQQDSYSPILYSSALYARSWLDPSPSGTNNIFRSMIEGALSNSMTITSAISDAGSKLDFLLLK